MKNKNGITLIALVITIIVLLILAGVSISLVTGDNGIATKAREASSQTQIAKEQEEKDLQKIYNFIDDAENDNLSGGDTETDGSDETTGDNETDGSDETTEDNENEAALEVSLNCTLEGGYFTLGYIVSGDVTISNVKEEDYPLTIEYYVDNELYDSETLTTGTTTSISDIYCTHLMVKVITQSGTYVTAERTSGGSRSRVKSSILQKI